MPTRTFVDIPQEEPRQMLAVLRRARYGYLLALHLLLLCAAGRKPTTIAAVLFCSRSSVHRTGHAYQEGLLGLEHDDQGWLLPPVRPTVLVPTLRRSILALLKAAPYAYGWCRTRRSCATLALTLEAKRGITVSAETMRRWRHEIGWGWKRAKLVAKDDDPQRVTRLARIRWVFEQLKPSEAMAFADELDIHLVPKVVTLLFLPTYGPRANLLDRAFGDIHDCCTRNHTRKCLRDLIADVEAHLQVKGPWHYKLSALYDEPAVTAAVENIAAEDNPKVAA
jgi:hypothetical protein